MYDDQDGLLRMGNIYYTYTPEGRLSKKIDMEDPLDPQTTEYMYDQRDNLERVNLPGGPQITYLTDSKDRRVAKYVDGDLSQEWIYKNQLEPIHEKYYHSPNNIDHIQYVYGSRSHVPDLMFKNNQAYHYLVDHVGSVRALLDHNGQFVGGVLGLEPHRPLGHGAMLGQSFSFAGAIADEHTGLLKMGRRDYDPLLGRWTSKEPLRFGAGIESFYLYAHGDPIDFIDIDGNIALPVLIFAGAGVLAITGGIVYGAIYSTDEVNIDQGNELKLFLDDDKKNFKRKFMAEFAKNINPHPDGCLQIIAHGGGGAIHSYRENFVSIKGSGRKIKELIDENNKKSECIELIICGGSGDDSLEKIAIETLYETDADYITYSNSKVNYLPSGQYVGDFTTINRLELEWIKIKNSNLYLNKDIYENWR